MGTINEALKYLKEDVDKLSNEEVEFLNNVIEAEGLESYLAETPFEIYDEDPRFIVFNAKDEQSNLSLADLLLTAGMYKRFHVYSGFNNVNLLKRKEIKKAYDVAKDEEKDIDLTYVVRYGDKVKDYLKNVEKVANDLIDLKVTDFIFDKDSFEKYKVNIAEFYNDLVNRLHRINDGYGLSSIKNDPTKDDEDMFNYTYTISNLEESLNAKEQKQKEEEEKAKLAQEIGLETDADLKRFRKEIKRPFESDLQALRRYRAELGPDFKIDESTALKESTILDLKDVVLDSYNHFVNDLGKTPSVDDILNDITDNYDGYADIQDTQESTNRWYSAISQELNRQALEVLNEGVSKDMTAEEIAKKHGVPLKDIEDQLVKGIKVEKEHTDDGEEATRIALDHLFEIPDYYTRLDKMEKDSINESKTLNEGHETRNYKGYELDLNLDLLDTIAEEGEGPVTVYILKDGKQVADVSGFKAAYKWVDEQVNNQIKEDVNTIKKLSLNDFDILNDEGYFCYLDLPEGDIKDAFKDLVKLNNPKESCEAVEISYYSYAMPDDEEYDKKEYEDSQIYVTFGLYDETDALPDSTNGEYSETSAVKGLVFEYDYSKMLADINENGDPILNNKFKANLNRVLKEWVNWLINNKFKHLLKGEVTEDLNESVDKPITEDISDSKAVQHSYKDIEKCAENVARAKGMKLCNHDDIFEVVEFTDEGVVVALCEKDAEDDYECTSAPLFETEEEFWSYLPESLHVDEYLDEDFDLSLLESNSLGSKSDALNNIAALLSNLLSKSLGRNIYAATSDKSSKIALGHFSSTEKDKVSNLIKSSLGDSGSNAEVKILPSGKDYAAVIDNISMARSRTAESLNDDESLNEDTVKQGKYWVNKGKEGTHGKFRTKKAADAQRKAMFARGFKESLIEEESLNEDYIVYTTMSDLEDVFDAYQKATDPKQKKELKKALNIALYQTYDHKGIDAERWEEIKASL